MKVFSYKQTVIIIVNNEKDRISKICFLFSTKQKKETHVAYVRTRHPHPHDSDAEAANKMQNSFISKYTGVICVLHVTGPIAFFYIRMF